MIYKIHQEHPFIENIYLIFQIGVVQKLQLKEGIKKKVTLIWFQFWKDLNFNLENSGISTKVYFET